MKKIRHQIFFLFLVINFLFASNNIPADNPYIQYFGRWDFSVPASPTHSWPGVYIYAEFEGTSIGIRMNDNFSYYNVFIDDKPPFVFHGTAAGVNNYPLVSGLANGNHKILLTLRNETNWTSFSFNGFILDDGKNLLPPSIKPVKKIEFIGDSYTVASGNEWTETGGAPNDSYTDIYKGFGAIIANNYGAQYQMSGRGGFGLVLDYQGNYGNTLPNYFDRTLVYTPSPKWNFSNWIPNLVVVCLGLNDYNGWGGYSGPLPEDNAALYRTKYHEFIATIMGEYPGANILAVAPNGIDWLKTNISLVVAEENAMGHTNVHYAHFPYYNGGYVNNGHPNTATHKKIADTLIYAIDAMNAWQPYQGSVPPRVTDSPFSPFTVYDTTYVLKIQTDSYATMRYSTEDKPYNQREYTFTTTGKRNHAVTLPCLHGTQNTYYARGIDIYGNAMDTSSVVQFTVDTTKSVVPWISASYDHVQWKKGKGPLGNANDTTIKTHTESATTIYYRTTFSISDFSSISSFTLAIAGHDGIAIYLNGTEFSRINLPASGITYNTLALQSSQYNQNISISRVSGLRMLQEGMNSIAVEVHAASSSTKSTLFNASLQDVNGKNYFSKDSLWHYYDGGGAPADHIVNKTTNSITEGSIVVPEKTVLYSNYPNPFNPSTTFSFSISTKTFVSLKIYDIIGKEIATIVAEELPAGTFTREWNPREAKGGKSRDVASGMYFYRLTAGSFVETKKLLLLK